MKRLHIIVLVVLGFLLMPASTFACGCNSGQKSCTKEVAANTEKTDRCKMDCCKNDNHSKNKNNDCNGKCGHSNCVTSSTHFSVLPSETRFQINNFAFSEKNQNYFNSETNLSSGFSSIWLIPKIS